MNYFTIFRLTVLIALFGGFTSNSLSAQCTQPDPNSVYIDLEDALPCGASCGTPTVTPFEIWSNEGYLLGTLTAGSSYNFTLGTPTGPGWNPTITLAAWTGTAVGAVAAFVNGRNLSVTIPTTGDYIVIISETGTCNGAATNGINNGTLSIDCGIGGATCPATNPDMGLTAISGSEYTITPLTQVTPINFSADVENVGSANATDASLTVNVYDVTNLTTPIQTLVSATAAVNAAATATLNTTASFTPAAAAANYVFEYITTATGDVNTANDTAYSSLSITNDLYARDDASITFNAGIGAGPLGYLGSMYTITATTPLDSVFVAFNKPGTSNTLGDGVGDSTRVIIFDVAAGLPNAEIGRSDAYVFTPADTSVLITRTFAIDATAGGTLNLAPGTYFVAVEENNTNVGLAFTDNNFQLNTFYFSWTGQPWTPAENFPVQFQRVPVIRPILGCLLTATATTTDAICSPNGSIDLSVSNAIGTATYAWDNNATTEDISNLAAGTYTVTVSAGGGCEVVESFTISSTSVAITSNGSSTDATCTTTDGTATATPTNGTAPYTYLWDNAATTQSISNLAANSYNVTITDANGCTGTQTVVVNSNSINITANTTTTNAGCGAADGTATAAPTNGTAPYTFLWSTGATTATETGLAAGAYPVTITDANGCEGVVSANVSNAGSPTSSTAVTSNFNGENVSCNGFSDGEATVTASGGSAPYTYAWTGGQTTAVATGLMANVYSVTVTDNASCSSVSTITITEPAVVAISAANTTISCNGGSDGAIDLTVSGGTGAYTFSWSNGATTEDLTALTAGAYTATVTDANGCSIVDGPLTITEPTAIVIGNALIADASCNGDADGAIDLTVSGGTGAYTFSWSNGATTEDLTALAAGSYTSTITDANGCEIVGGPLTISEPTAIAISAANTTDVSCNADADGAIDLTVSGGTPTYTFSWSNGATTEDLTALVAGTYTGTITDANGCEIVGGPLTITEPTAVAATTTVTNVTSAGGTDGAVDLTVSGGTGSYTFVWDNGATTEDLTGVAAGTYSVTITDANGCTSTASETVLDGPSSITATASNIDLNLFPNPAKDQATLTLNLTQIADVNVEVVNVTGQVLTNINSADVLNTQFELNMTDWAAGVYFVRITAGEETTTVRLVKQ